MPARCDNTGRANEKEDLVNHDNTPDRLGRGIEALIPQQSPFDTIRRTTPEGREYWSARELMPLLGYEEWRKFDGAIDRARISARNTGRDASDHIVGAAKMVATGSGAQRRIEDRHLSRFACYLIAMNGDVRKPEIAAAQTYFVIKTRQAETAPAYEIPQTYAAALRLAADETERAELAEARVAELAPKADLADDYLIAEGGARLVREVAKTIGMKEKDFRRWLIDEKLIFVKHSACGAVQYDYYAQYAHYFQAREKVIEHQHGLCTHYTLMVLPRGVELIHRRMKGNAA